MTNQHASEPRATEESETVALLQEVADVETRPVTTGRVHVRTHVETVQEMAHATLEGEAVEVTRVARNIPVTGAVPEIRTEGDVTIVPVFEEVLVVEKRLMLKEELHIRKRTTTETVDVPVTLRQQSATVERVDAEGLPGVDARPATTS